MIVFGGGSSIDLAGEIAKNIGCELGSVEVKRFPDGELFVRIDSDTEGDDAVVIQGTGKGQDENLMEFLFILDALHDQAEKVVAVIPYYYYGRQDRAFNKGEAVSSKTLAKLIQTSADVVLLVNPHKEHILEYFDVPSLSLDASHLIGEFFKKKRLKDPLVVSPDSGSAVLAQRVAHVIECRFGNCEKKRLGPGRVVTSAEGLRLRGEEVILVDDIIDTGGTIVEASKVLREKGANEIHVACIHPVFTGNAAARILEVAEDLVATNTISSGYSKISVAPLLTEGINKVLLKGG